MIKLVLASLMLVSQVWTISSSPAKPSFNKVEWVKANQVSISELTPSGWEIVRNSNPHANISIYVTRVQHLYPNTFIPGKYYVAPNGVHRAFAAYKGTTVTSNDVELLVFPPNAVEWVKAKGHVVIKKNTVFGGVDPEYMEEVFVCRAMFMDRISGWSGLITGKYVPSRGLCLNEYVGEHLYDEFEILTVSNHGQAIGAGNGRRCVQPVNGSNPSIVQWVKRDQVDISSLPAAGWTPVEVGSEIVNVSTFTARGKYSYQNESTFIPGKFYVRPNEKEVAYFGVGGLEYSAQEFELLVYPQNSAIFVNSIGHEIVTPRHIYGGIDPFSREEVYVCRAFYTHFANQIALVTGKYVPTRGLCAVPWGMYERLHDQYELLVVREQWEPEQIGNGRTCN